MGWPLLALLSPLGAFIGLGATAADKSDDDDTLPWWLAPLVALLAILVAFVLLNREGYFKEAFRFVGGAWHDLFTFLGKLVPSFSVGD